MENILVVGGAGYIGSHAIRSLKAAGYNAVVYDNLSKGHGSAAKGFKFIKGDLGDKKKLLKVFAEQKISAVMHFAALAEVGQSVKEPALYYKNNTAKVLSLLDAMVEAGVKYFVFSSTAAVFGEPIKKYIDEAHPKRPINPYGKTKLMVENILQDYALAYGLKSAVLRYFNAAGADDTGDIGEAHTPETHLIPLILQAALGKREDIKIFGSNYKTKDGTCVRDYIHVNDLASAHLLALKYIQKHNTCADFNLGSSKGFSVKEMIDCARKITGRKIKTQTVARRAGDPAVLVANSKKAAKALGWTPKYNLDKIIATAWNWEKHRKY
ncbi:MAG: UDP-glucose 4-epimerase GalE [Elusimicrobiota bacterium]|nr:UDP-glucose 4-epimerase GalE [Elusimicrobiota bacterium]